MLRAALHYFLIIFGLGFLFGTVRTLWLAPAIGATAAVLCEVPLMLLASWLVAGRIVRPWSPGQRAAFATGLLALVMLLAAELALALTLGRQSPTAWIRGLIETPGWIGLCAQLLFGLFPWLQVRRSGS